MYVILLLAIFLVYDKILLESGSHMKSFFKKNIDKIVYIFLIMQPLIDILTAISMNVFHLKITFGMIIRMLFLVFLYIYNFMITKPSKKNIIFTILTILYIMFFSVNTYLTKDMSVLFYELKNLARYLYFPCLLWNMYEVKKKEKIEIEEKKLNIIYLIYLTFIIIPMLTNTDFSGYTQGKIGTIGWFASTNEIGGILSGLIPYLLLGKNIKQFIPLFIITTIVFFSLGSKITCLSLIIVLLIYVVKRVLKSKNKKKVVGLLIPSGIITIIIGCILLPKTAFYKNIETHLNFLEIDSITDIVKDKKLIDHFIFSSRLRFLKNTKENYNLANIPTKLIGLGFIENYRADQVNLKTIEMDIFDIFFRTGILGTILLISPIIIILKEEKYKSTMKKNTSLCLFVMISTLAGHVLTSPAVSIYVSLIFIDYIKESRP